MAAGAPDGDRRAAPLWALFALLVLQGLGGIGGGGALAMQPAGGLLKMPMSYLESSPFPDCRVPGVVLLLVLGVFPLAVAFGLLRRRPWAWFGAFAVGCGLMIFELVEISVMGYNVQQPTWGTIGLHIALVSLAPSVQYSCGLLWGCTSKGQHGKTRRMSFGSRCSPVLTRPSCGMAGSAPLCSQPHVASTSSSRRR